MITAERIRVCYDHTVSVSASVRLTGSSSSSSRATENMVGVEGDLMGASLLLLQLTASYLSSLYSRLRGRSLCIEKDTDGLLK